jgi:hypothetical protein
MGEYNLLRIFVSNASPVSPILLDPLGDGFLLVLDNVHRRVVLVEIIPAGALMRRVTCPNHAKLIDMLRLGPVYATICPWRCSYVRSSVCKFVHDGTDDRLERVNVV